MSSRTLPLERDGRGERTGSDIEIITLVSGAHFLSHFLQLTLPPLFPLLRAVFNVPYVALGVLMTLFYSASAVGQLVSGFLVDRFGARRILVGGLSLFASAIVLAGLSPSYGMLVAVILLAGLGNSVFHPADYSIMNATVDSRRLGRAYSTHSISGNIGWALAPAVVGGLTAAFGWRVALASAGALGLAVAFFLARQPALAVVGRPARMRVADGPVGFVADFRLLLVTPVLMAFAYFALLAASLSAVQTFSVSVLVAVYAAPLGLASGALTAYLGGSAAGILTGGVLADRTSRHHVVAGGGMLLAAVLTLVLASGAPPLALLAPLMAAIGFAKGATAPSRDLIVRAATPAAASGKVFGFVYSGLDLGALAMPPVYGWLVDRGDPRAVFLVAAGLMVLTIATVLEVRRQGVIARGRGTRW
ncbi:MAG: MFS transporter [Candidatus Rokubacteria bacterium]|nr:MFS transporter [Candidatus Rokubacteria bacterium]